MASGTGPADAATRAHTPCLAPQIELERAAKEAVSREKSLVEASLQAEQRLADAMRKASARYGGSSVEGCRPALWSAWNRQGVLAPRAACPQHSSTPTSITALLAARPQETAATSEALQAERAAKFAADAEARELQRVLDETAKSLESERAFSQKLGAQAKATQEELKQAMQVGTGGASCLQARRMVCCLLGHGWLSAAAPARLQSPPTHPNSTRPPAAGQRRPGKGQGCGGGRSGGREGARAAAGGGRRRPGGQAGRGFSGGGEAKRVWVLGC